jgi:crotonobetainyl-CoA:carnitine CoA-transferase CaiB-like acyl-CoA transferase
LAPPWGFSRTPASIDRHAPRLGEHSDEILTELGLDDAAIAALRSASAIR